MHPNTPFLPHAVSLPHPFRSSSIDMGGVGGVQRREEEENANNAFFLFSPPPPPPKRRRRSSMSSSFGSNFATTSSSSNLSLMKLTPRTGICATALARMRYLSSLFVFFFLRDLCLKRGDVLLKNSSSTKTGHPIRRRTRDARSRRFTLCRKRKERRRRRQR
jgi:hypothetical protein